MNDKLMELLNLRVKWIARNAACQVEMAGHSKNGKLMTYGELQSWGEYQEAERAYNDAGGDDGLITELIAELKASGGITR